MFLSLAAAAIAGAGVAGSVEDEAGNIVSPSSTATDNGVTGDDGVVLSGVVLPRRPVLASSVRCPLCVGYSSRFGRGKRATK